MRRTPEGIEKTWPINVLVWHDEECESWTYCGCFKILTPEEDNDAYEDGYEPPKTVKLFELYRDNPKPLGSLNPSGRWFKDLQFIGFFPNIETAKVIAAIIRMNEYHQLPSD